MSPDRVRLNKLIRSPATSDRVVQHRDGKAAATPSSTNSGGTARSRSEGDTYHPQSVPRDPVAASAFCDGGTNQEIQTMKLAEMREKKGQLWSEITKLHEAMSDTATAEQESRWDEVNAEYDQLNRSIERAERMEALAADAETRREESEVHDRNVREANSRGLDLPTTEDRSLAFQAWSLFRTDDFEMTEAHEIACRRTGVKPQAQFFDFELPNTRDYRLFRQESRALGTGPAPDGGATVPEEFVRELEVALLAIGGLRPVASIMRTNSGAPMPWPTANDTTNEGEWLTENTATADDEDPAFGQVVFDAYKASSKMVRVAVELLEDSAFNMAAELGNMLGTRIARLTNRGYTTGTGTGQPTGIITAAPIGFTLASSSAITTDELIDFQHSVDPAYRNDMAAWQMHDLIAKEVRKLKDSEGRFIWEPRLTAGTPDLLLGFPVTYNQMMASAFAIDADIMTFGDHSKYKIRDVRGVRLRRSTERYVEFDQEGFVAFLRTDGNLVDAGTGPVKKLRMAAT